MEGTTTNTAHFLDLLFTPTDNESKDPPKHSDNEARPSKQWICVAKVSETSTPAEIDRYTSPVGECRMLPGSHLYDTEKLCVKKIQNKLNRCAIHYRQSKYFLIVSVHVNEVLHRSDFYRKQTNTKRRWVISSVYMILWCAMILLLYPYFSFGSCDLPANNDAWSPLIVWWGMILQ